MIGMGYAVRHPDRIARLVVLNTAAFHPPTGKRLPWQLSLCRSACLGPLLVRGLNAFCTGAARNCAVRRPLSDAVRRAYLAPYDSWSNRRAVLRFVQDIPLRPRDRAFDAVSEVDGGLPRLAHLPMLICWGLRDFVFDADFLNEWTRRFPRAEVHGFDDAGHYVLEDAAEEIVPLVSRFLDAGDRAAGQSSVGKSSAGQRSGGPVV
jgi:haloalkane dehalogenase